MTASTSPLDVILNALQSRGHKITHFGGQMTTKCPCHADEHESLTITLGDDGRVLIHCFAGCATEGIVAALGLTMASLFPPRANGSNGTSGTYVSERAYEVRDVAGNLIALHHRRDFSDPTKGKKMFWSRPGVPKGLGGLKVHDLPLYGTELLADAARADWGVVVVEGEKSADALRAWITDGLLVLATVTGAGKTPSAEQLEPLRGRDVLLWPDNDQKGRLHMVELALKLRPIAASAKLVEWKDGPARADAADFSGTADELRAILEGAVDLPAAGASGAAGHAIQSPAAAVEILDPKRTMHTAKRFVETHYTHPDGRTIHAYAGALWTWSDNRYVLTDDARIRHQLQPWLDAAVAEKQTENGAKLEPFPANTRTIADALMSVRDLTLAAPNVEPPSWIGPGDPPTPLHEMLPCRSATLHIPTRTLLPATPQLFATAAIDFDFDPAAPEPFEWLKFLDDLFGDDHEAIRMLQEWFGYCLTLDTSLQKVLLIVGPRRSGKGTLARILTQLVGTSNIAAPTVGSLAEPFGLAQLLGKSVAIISDARFAGEGISLVIERLLTVSGEDRIGINRKNKPYITAKLPTRFMILSNESPRLPDAAQALASRFVTLSLRNSFLGREDHRLTDRLLEELPGILGWALDGLESLHERGRLQEPASSEEARQEIEDLSSPVAAFLRQKCEIGATEDHEVVCDALYAAWTGWCQADGRAHPSTRQTFGRDLRAVVPTLKTRQTTGGLRKYSGLRLRG